MSKHTLSRSDVIEQADDRTAKELGGDAVKTAQLFVQVAQRVGVNSVRPELKQLAELGDWAGRLLEQVRPTPWP